ncbi:polyhydroxyalkanoic acid system family protein [Rubrivirga sp. S365]|uniref:Polyhydroxyalkanoic acid system family protein n=1 Tax=Rubrivirga litoralis TaxID=3075598 RepID=A0ABU3BRH4_9BACT|nr:MULTISPECIES: polyhydroxyalkanoic acid system family protein [unclassified Rubrivirga]MDT0631850.1 polyhydroxyalkanoic acid system family protein [Rubrivirga sp. F394]MDT7857903.1 polyhydroxyalkanoic acid system family protein [Rubrivirga sp. S365]
MADIDLTRPHDLGLDGARRAADAVAERLRREYGVTAEWEGDSIRLDGRGVRGRLDAQPTAVRVTASLGLAARPFRRALRREIERELDAFAPSAPPPTP